MEGNKVSNIFKKLPLKIKLIIIGALLIFLFNFIFLVIMIVPLMSLDIIDISKISGNMLSGRRGGTNNYSMISSSSGYWWPIGSSETEEKDGKIYASGEPLSSKSDDYPDGVSSYFGQREAPIKGATTDHGAIDIPVPEGTNVIAPLSGTISYINTDPSADGCGIYVKMQDSNNNEMLFCHLSEVKVSLNENVDQGQVIALSGNTGTSSGPHLHFGLIVNGIKVDPLNYVDIDNPRPEKKTIKYTDGNSNQQSVCLTLLNTYSINGTAAVLTNINAESGFDPSIIGDYGTSYGLCQWHDSPIGSGRWTNLKNTFPNNYTTIEGQLSFLDYELINNYTGLRDNLISGSLSAEQLAYNYCYYFEVPANRNTTCTDRGRASYGFLTYVQNGCK